MYYLYRIINQVNQKVYIGQSNKEKERWRQHKYFAKNPEKTGQYIHRAMAKYGVENFIYEVISICKTSEDADFTETQLINQYNSRNKENGYNLAPGGDIPWNRGLPKELNPLTGVPRSEETKRKISEATIGKIMPPCSEDRKQKMSEKYSGRTLPAAWVEKIANSHRGKKRSAESKQRMSASHIGKTGEKSSNHKLNWEIVNQIREKYSSNNYSQKDLAREYKISQCQINYIIKNKSWVI